MCVETLRLRRQPELSPIRSTKPQIAGRHAKLRPLSLPLLSVLLLPPPLLARPPLPLPVRLLPPPLPLQPLALLPTSLRHPLLPARRLGLSPSTPAAIWKAEIITKNGELHWNTAKAFARRTAGAKRTLMMSGIATAF